MLRIAAFVALIAIGSIQEPVFKDIKMNVQKGEKTEQYDVTIRFTPDALVMAGQKKATVRSLSYLASHSNRSSPTSG